MKKYIARSFENTRRGTVVNIYNYDLHCYQTMTFCGYNKREMVDRLRNVYGVVVPKKLEGAR